MAGLTLDSLTADQLRALRDGDPLTFPAGEACPLKAGDVIVLESVRGLAFNEDELEDGIGRLEPVVETPILWVKVTKVRRTRKLLWRVLYRLYDHRPLWLKNGPPKPEGSRLRQTMWTEAEEHGLTGRVISALDPTAEVIGGPYANVIEMGARLKAAERQDAETVRRQARSVAEAIKQVMVMGARSGVDMTPYLAQIQQTIQAAEAELDEAA